MQMAKEAHKQTKWVTRSSKYGSQHLEPQFHFLIHSPSIQASPGDNMKSEIAE